MKQKNITSSLKSQVGAGALEFLISILPIFLLTFATIETSRWYQYKTYLRSALLHAQRDAAIHHLDPKVLIKAFENNLQPIFKDSHQFNIFEQQLAKKLSSQNIPSWQMRINSPKASAFQDFLDSDTSIAKQTGLSTINNDYQFEQHQEKGIGRVSQQTIFQANTLEIELVFPHKPLTPGMTGLFQLLQKFYQDPLKQNYAKAGYLPISLHNQYSMHSHPALWPSPESKKVIWDTDNFNIQQSNVTEPCLGIWCKSEINSASNKNNINNNINESIISNGKVNGDSKATSTDNQKIELNHDSEANQTIQNEISQEDPLCGISLCCL